MSDSERVRAEYEKALEKLGRRAPDMAAGFPPPDRIRINAPLAPPDADQSPAAPGSQAEADSDPATEPTHGERPRGRMRGLGRIYQRGAIWWVQYSHRGKVYRQSSKSSNRTDAVKLLRRKLGEIGRGRLIGPDVEKTTFADLAGMLLNDYRVNGRRSLDRVEAAVGHLREAFSEALALDITADRITSYVVDRQAVGAAPATINRELSALKRMFRLGERAGKVVQRPHIPMLQERNVRKGFFEADHFRAVLARLPEDLQPVFEIAHATGWRVKSEILTRRWFHVDFKAGWLRLEPGETKNGDGRMFPLTPDLRAVLERQRARTEALQRATAQIIPWVFHRDGKPIKSFRRAWLAACKHAGVPGRIPHDFRRTAVRNLERAGVPRSVAMKLVGHRTESVYRRYAITTEADLREGAAKLAALHQAEHGKPRTVLPLRSNTALAQSGRGTG